MEQEIEDKGKHLAALTNATTRTRKKLEGVGSKDPKEILEMIFEEVLKSEYKTEVINYQKEIIENLKRQIK